MWPLDPDDPHFDMLNSLRAMIAGESPITWTTRHIDGHQDDDINATLDWWAWQNIQMDNLAKVFWMNHSHSAPVQYSISHEGFQVWLGDHKLSSSPSSAFFDHIHGNTILAWHTTHHPFLHAMRDASTGPSVLRLSNAFLWAADNRCQSIPPVFVVLVPRC
jgi:hypothetical protein